jgi:uncharacterized protein YhfF
MLREHEFDNDPLPRVGEFSIMTAGQAKSLRIIETMEVASKAFHSLDSQFAFDEGEGDRSPMY